MCYGVIIKYRYCAFCVCHKRNLGFATYPNLPIGILLIIIILAPK